MSYISKRLAPGEAIVAEGRFHWLQHVWPWMALLLLGVVIIGVIIWVKEMVRLNTTDFLVTNRRIVLKKGIFNVDVDEMNLSSIEGSHIDQSILGRIFGYGRLTIRGRGEMEIRFPTMARAGEFRAAAEGARMEGEIHPVEEAVERVAHETRAAE